MQIPEAVQQVQAIARDDAKSASWLAKTRPGEPWPYAHAGDDTGRVVAEVYRQHGADAAALVMAKFHRAFCEHVTAPNVEVPTWAEQAQKAGHALSIKLNQTECVEVTEAMRKLRIAD